MAKTKEQQKAAQMRYYHKHKAKRCSDRMTYYWKHRETEKRKCNERAHFRKYGMTLKEKSEILWGQKGLCAICGTSNCTRIEWHTDHDHKTGAFRGIICRHCNHMLGQAKDNPATLMSAVIYLTKGAINGPSLHQQ